MRKIGVFLRNRFLEGLLVVVPLLVVYFLLKWLFLFIHEILENVVKILHLQSFVDFHVWVLEILSFFGLVLLLLFLSVLLRTFFGKIIRKQVEKFFESFPGVGTIYGAVKQISKIFFREEGAEPFPTVVVLVAFPSENTKSLGFLIGQLKSDVLPSSMKDEQLLVVYIPTAPFPTTGYLLLMKPDSVQKTDLTWERAVKIIFSGGMLDGD